MRQADTRGSGCWLVSSNVANNAFYRARGFEVVKTFVIGEGNPTWGEPPVPIEIVSASDCEVENVWLMFDLQMVREPKALGD